MVQESIKSILPLQGIHFSYIPQCCFCYATIARRIAIAQQTRSHRVGGTLIYSSSELLEMAAAVSHWRRRRSSLCAALVVVGAVIVAFFGVSPCNALLLSEEAEEDNKSLVSRIAFGSCANQSAPQVFSFLLLFFFPNNSVILRKKKQFVIRQIDLSRRSKYLS